MPTTIDQVYFRKCRCVAGFSIYKRQKMNKVTKSEMKRNSENTPSCKRIIFVAYGSTMIKALRQNNVLTWHKLETYLENIRFCVSRPALCILFLFLCVFVPSAFYLDTFQMRRITRPPKDGIKLQIDPYLYYRHLCHCSSFICRYHVQISCFTFDFKRWPTLCACSYI